MMNRTFIALIIVLSVLECNGQKFVSAKWEKQSFKEQESIPLFDYLYNNEGKLLYLITNDSANLYVRLKAVDEVAQKKIFMFGFNVWLDTTAKNKKQMCIKYPLPGNERAGNRAGDTEVKRNRRNFDEYKKRTINQLLEIELVGFSGKKSSQYILANNSNNISGKIQMSENGDVHYLLSIPYKSIGVKYEPGMFLSLNLESGYSSEEMRPEGTRPGGMSGGRPGGAGGSRPEGISGGRPGGQGGRNPQMMQERMQERQQLSTPIKIHLKKVKLL